MRDKLPTTMTHHSSPITQHSEATLWELIERAIERHGDAPALALRDDEPQYGWSYRELRQRIETAAESLAAHGIARGDRVLLWGANRPQWGAAFLALLRIGAVAVPLDFRSAPEFIQRVAEQTRPKALLADRSLSDSLDIEIGPRLLIDDLAAGAPSPMPPPSLGAASGRLPPLQGDLDDLVEIVFTSGTTGEPKGVMITNRNLLANVHAIEKVIEISPRDRLVSLLPLSHLFEQIVLIVVLGAGGSTVYLQTLKPATILEAIRQERATCMMVVPQVLDLFLSGIEREVRRAGKRMQFELLHAIARRLPFGLRRHLFRPLHQKLGGQFDFFVCGGAALDPELGRRWENMGIQVVQGYGLTEATPAVAANRLDDRSMDTVGWPVEGIELKIADDGEILIRGPQLTPGYWENEQATAAAFEDGWYRTGDLGEFDRRGRLRLKGRKKDLIVLANGLNVYPEDVETALRLHPAIKDAVVLGLKRGRADIDVHAVLVMREEGEEGGEGEEGRSQKSEVRRALRAANGRLAAHQQIRGYTIWPEEDFPRTLTLKPRRPIIQARLKEMGVGDAG